MRRLLAVLTIAGVVALFFPAIVSAQISVEVTIKHPPDGAGVEEARKWTPRPDSVVEGSWRAVAEVRSDSPLASFELKIATETPGIPPLDGSARVARSFPVGDNATFDRLEIVWNTRTLTPYNASYRVIAKAATHIAESDEAQARGIVVDNPPLAPNQVSAELTAPRQEEKDQQPRGVPEVRWSPNSEPDLLHYRVLRSEGSSAFADIATSSGTSFRDLTAPEGESLRYRIVAVRNSLVSSRGIGSSPSLQTATIVIPKAKDPVQLPKPEPAPVAEVRGRDIVGPRRDTGFAPTLPYSAQDLELPFGQPQTIEEEQAQQEYFQENASLATRVLSTSARKPPFIAGALLLLALAVHLGRISLRLFSTT